MKRFAYIAWQVIWGLPQTVVGLIVLMVHAACPHYWHHGALVTIWAKNAGLSLGPFVFLNAPHTPPGQTPSQEWVNDRLLVHEYGHTVQSLILGPLYLLVIGLPSVIWLNSSSLSRRRRVRGTSYYSFYTERWANALGEAMLKRPSMGQAFIDI